MENSIRYQNSDENLDRLAAMRQMYSDAKKLFAGEIILTVVLPAVIAIVSILPETNTNLWERVLAIWGIVAALIDRNMIKNNIDKLKEAAANIQEEFDCKVLDIDTNPIKAKQIEPEETMKYRGKYLKQNNNYSDVERWYRPEEKLKSLPINQARALCQRQNCLWDIRLRKKYDIFIKVLVFCAAAIIIGTAMSRDLTTCSVIFNMIVPIFPVGLFLCESRDNSKNSMDKRERAVQACDECLNLSKVVGNEAKIDKLARQIQNEIFDDRRESLLIFDWFYKIFKDKQQNEENNATQRMIDDL